jgi:CheY-like chemotaxis protein
MQLKRETVDAHGSVRNAVSMLSGAIAAKPLHVQLALEASEHHVDADPGRLQQIFLNLISNAVKFTPAHGSVTVRSANVGNCLDVEVIDTGPGIPVDLLPTIFDRFNPAAQSTGALGIGLAITRSLVEMHGGRIAAQSPAGGGGARLTVELPTAQAAQRRSGGGGFGGTILLVEDHQDTRNVMGRLLRSFGFEVTLAGSVAEALGLASDHKFDLLISDIGLPDGTGNEIMRELRKRMPVKGVALSGYGQADDLRRSEEAGFDAHLVKPVNFQTLRTMLDDLLKPR